MEAQILVIYIAVLKKYVVNLSTKKYIGINNKYLVIVSIKFLLIVLFFTFIEKKKLIDARTISVDYQGWIEFNVSSTLNHWLNHSNKNFGFDVEVEDSYGNKLNPNLYFQNINCSAETSKFDILYTYIFVS